MYIDLKKGDTILSGRFKNIPYVVKEFGVDKNNQPTVTTESGKTLKLLSVRIKKLMKKEPINDTIEGTVKEGTGMIRLKSLIKETSEFRSQSVDKYKQPREELLATNESSYHWEYDTMIYYAMLFVNTNTEELRLVITHTHIKSGLGKGEQTERVFQLLVGTVSSPNKGAIRQALTKYGYKRSRSETPYGLWYPGQGLQPQKLDSILANYR
ncbi:MAG: hypothetical protein WC306_03825 [Candidatus Paceibacterota bacterium]|jgi:hypothetical protein